jgi:serine/threonine protein kinase
MLTENDELVMVDFGISDRWEDGDDFIPLKGGGRNKGTPLYFAPEVVKTKVKDKQVRGK